MSRLNLSSRFTLILIGVFLVGTAIGGVIYWRALQGQAQDEIAAQGTLLIETMNAVRGYTSKNVKPILADELVSSPQFIPETVPAFSARSVFENFRDQPKYKIYNYKEASPNPTNPLDMADDFEAGLYQKMTSGETAGEISGFRDQGDGRLFYIARPLKIGNESCLQCHTTPDKAPASLIAKYGDKNGFGWKLGQTIAIQIIYVPAGEVYDAAFRTFTMVMIIFIVTFAFVILVINTLLRRYVIQPVNVLSGLANKISTDENFSADLESSALHSITRRPDELGNLAQVFRKMAADVYARTGLLKTQVDQLIIKIDELRRKQQVSDVVESEFFTDLQKRARELRNKGQDPSGETKGPSE